MPVVGEVHAAPVRQDQVDLGVRRADRLAEPYAFVETEDRGPSPDREFEANQARALVLAALQRIPLPRRAVLVMHDLDQVPMQEVAATLSIPLFTAYSRLRKARLELATAITQIQRRSSDDYSCS